MEKKTSFGALAVCMLCFFTMGFVDLVGIASNYVKADIGLTDAQANIMPSLVFFWFLIFSVPTGILMNKIGRKKTVLLSIIVTAVALLLPLCGESYPLILCAFSLLAVACGDDSSSDVFYAQGNSTSDLVVPVYDDLPVCSSTREGVTAYVKDEKMAYICQDTVWTVDGEGDGAVSSSSRQSQQESTSSSDDSNSSDSNSDTSSSDDSNVSS